MRHPLQHRAFPARLKSHVQVTGYPVTAGGVVTVSVSHDNSTLRSVYWAIK